MAFQTPSKLDHPTVSTRHTAHRIRRKPLVRMTRKQHDLWEHAALLHHGYEWHAAAQSFRYLAHEISTDLESHLCLLNAALTFARLGDYAIAAEMLEGAVQVEELLPFTLYLMGHVELQLEARHIDKAKRCFTVALQRLDLVGGSQHLHHFGLAFTLKATKLHRTLGMLETYDDDLRLMSLGAIAANGIFEAPKKSWNTSSIAVKAVGMTDTILEFNPIDSAKFASPPPDYSSDGSSSIKAYPVPRKSTTPAIWRHRSTQLNPAALTDSLNSLRKDLIGSVSHSSRAAVTVIREQSTLLRRASWASLRLRNDDSAPADTPPVPPIPIQVPSHRQPLHRPSPEMNKSLPPLPRARSRMIARDAQGLGEPTTALAHFIKSLPSPGGRVARDAEAHFGPMRELGDFLRDSGPEDAKPPPVEHIRTATPVSIRTLRVREVQTPRSSLRSSFAASRSCSESTSPESVSSSLLRGGDYEDEKQPLTDQLPRVLAPRMRIRYCRSAATLESRPRSPPTAKHPALRPHSTFAPNEREEDDCASNGWNGKPYPSFVLQVVKADSDNQLLCSPIELQGEITVALGSPVSPPSPAAWD